MAKIKISKTDLLYQIDQQSKRGDLPDTFLLEGITVLPQDEIDPLEQEYPNIRKLFTWTEYIIFRELWLHKGQFVSMKALVSAVDSDGLRGMNGQGARNCISTHMKNMRKKLPTSFLARVKIVTRKSGVGENKDGYTLEI